MMPSICEAMQQQPKELAEKLEQHEDEKPRGVGGSKWRAPDRRPTCTSPSAVSAAHAWPSLHGHRIVGTAVTWNLERHQSSFRLLLLPRFTRVRYIRPPNRLVRLLRDPQRTMSLLLDTPVSSRPFIYPIANYLLIAYPDALSIYGPRGIV